MVDIYRCKNCDARGHDLVMANCRANASAVSGHVPVYTDEAEAAWQLVAADVTRYNVRREQLYEDVSSAIQQATHLRLFEEAALLLKVRDTLISFRREVVRNDIDYIPHEAKVAP